MILRRPLARLVAGLALATGCGGAAGPFGPGVVEPRTPLADEPGFRQPSRTAISLRLAKRLSPQMGGRYIPVEHAGVAMDPARERLYIGLDDGSLRALDADGHELYRYEVGAPIDATPALDRVRNILYVAANDGTIHALDARDGSRKWVENVGHAIAQPPILTATAIYAVAEDDVVTAIAREDGTVLWNYRRPPSDEITIKGHAGVVQIGDHLYTAFNDGVVVCLDPADGSAVWELDTSVDLDPGGAAGVPRFRDVDTTPVLVGERLYVASFAAGLYALDPESGTVLDRDATQTGITALAKAGETGILTVSADLGISLFEAGAREPTWTKAIDRGAPSRPVITSGNLVLYGESVGSLIVLELATGHEVGRFESGFGFVAQPSASGNLAAVVSNSGTLFLLDLN